MHCFAALWLVNWDLHQVAVQVPASACTAKAVIQKHLFLQMSLCLSWFSNLTSSHFSPRPQLQTQHPCFTSVCDKDEVSTRRVEEEERIWSSWSPSPTSIWVLWHCYGGKMFFNCSQRKQRWKCHTVRYKRCLFFFFLAFLCWTKMCRCNRCSSTVYSRSLSDPWHFVRRSLSLRSCRCTCYLYSRLGLFAWRKRRARNAFEIIGNADVWAFPITLRFYNSIYH